MLLDPGLNLTLRPMRYPQFYESYKTALKNTWSVEEVDFTSDLSDLARRLTPAERFMINRLVAFFATGDSIVSNNLVLNYYGHLNAPEARVYLSRQLFEEALHVQFYLTLLDTYIPDQAERQAAFSAVETVPSIKRKADFCFKWIDSIREIDSLQTKEDRRKFFLNMICFATCVEGIFFFAAFAYVYFLRSKGLLNGLAAGTNWVFRDESAHIAFAFSVIDVIRQEEPDLFDAKTQRACIEMLADAVECESAFASDVLDQGIAGLSIVDMRRYLEYIADQRLVRLGLAPHYRSANPFDFMNLQDTQELANFFERRVSAYQVGVTGTVQFDQDF